MKYLLLFVIVLIHDHVSAQDKNPTIYSVVQQMPEYPGGEDSMWRFIHAHIRYPDSAANHNIQGRVVLGFVVNENGSLSDITVKKGLTWDLDSEAVRVVKQLSHFNPGKQDGKPVKVSYVLPLTFKLKIDSARRQPKLYDSMPEFPGGKAKMMEFISSNIQYPHDAEMFNVQGVITVKFMVAEDGHLSDFVVPLNGDPSLVRESLRVISLMPPFKPAMKDGKPVKAPYSLPIGFKLSSDSKGLDTVKLDKYPQFPGGDTAELGFMNRNIKYPVDARDKDIQGIVVVAFIVNEDGSLSDFRILKSIQKDLDAEAMRVAKMLPKFKPAMREGKAVKAVFEFPINFKLKETQKY